MSGVILSNGTLLTPERATLIRDLGLRLMISLDGLGMYHDGQRPYAHGGGSFAATAAGVEQALAAGLDLHVSVTVSGRSVAGLPALLDWLLARDLPFSLNYYRENEHSAGHVELKLEESQIIAGMTAAIEVVAARLPRRSLLASFVDRANLAVAHTHTCGVGDDYVVFDYRGRISQCQMHLQAPIGDLGSGDVLAQVRTRGAGIMNLHVDEKEGCRSCGWKHWCTGGCPLATFRATGRYDVQSPNCGIYQAVFPLVLALEGRRILRYLGAAESPGPV